jgi:tetratricopeptide (TPR) repeat protein
LPPSARFGKFVRVSKLGAGGMGEVWKAWDADLSRWVALKFMRIPDPDELARFRREAQMAGRLAHPNIAAVYEFGETAGTPWIAMEYIPGQTLKTFPRNDRKLLVRLVRDAARAVQHANEEGIVHRDLKPENLMVVERKKTSTGRFTAGGHRLYVMDFGLARPTEGASDLSASGLVVGTPHYMAPEQARGERAGAPADVWSLGATLYELLTDRKPFSGSNVLEVLKSAQESEPKAPRRVDPTIDADLETITLKCLEKEAGRRYPSAQGLADDLGRWLEGDPILARRHSVLYRLKKRVLKNRALSGAVGAAVLIAAGAAVVLTVSAMQRSTERRHEAGARKDVVDSAELCRRALDNVKEGKALLRVRTAKREQWEERFAKALEQATAAVEKFPRLAGAHDTLGEVKEAQGRWAEAIAALDRALELDPTLENAWYRRGLCGLELYEEIMGSPETLRTPEVSESLRRRAEPYKERVILDLRKYSELRRKTAETDFEARYSRAAFAYAEGRHDEAEKICDELLSEIGSNERVWLLKARVQMSRKGWDGIAAIATLDRVISDVMPNSLQAFLARGRAKLQKDDFDGALLDYSAAVGLNPNHALPFRHRAAAKSNRGDFTGALEDDNKAIEIGPESADLFRSRAHTRMNLKEYRGALEDCSKALGFEPTNHEALVLRGSVRERMNDLEGAAEDYALIIRLYPEDCTGLFLLAKVKAKRGDFEGAVREYTRMLELDPKLGSIYGERGSVKLMLGDLKGTIEDCTEAIKLNPGNPESYAIRGLARSRSGDREGATRDIEKFAELAPTGKPTPHGWYYRGIVRFARGDFAGAIEDCTRAVALDPHHAEAFYVRACARAGLATPDHAGAIEDLSRAIEVRPRLLEAYLQRGFFRAQLENPDWAGALQDYTKALEIAPKDWPMRKQLEDSLRMVEGKVHRYVDVTERVLAEVKDNKVSIVASNANFGDPAPGVVKKLRIDYLEGGEPRSKTVQENETLVIVAGDGKPLIVKKAVYGALP